jgi:hypothetical protein
MRSIVRNFNRRCERCRQPPRWCVCAANREVSLPLEIDLLVHHREWYRPSSTSQLIQRVIPAARRQVWRRERQVPVADIRRPGRDLWILHPHGGPPPTAVGPDRIQVVLLDGSWRETSAMAQEVAGWGQLVSLPMVGESRYWLRAQADAGRFSTVESLLFLLRSLGLDHAHHELWWQFELHVYASLRMRGHKERAAEFLQTSPVPGAFPEMLAELHRRRPHEPDREPKAEGKE